MRVLVCLLDRFFSSLFLASEFQHKRWIAVVLSGHIALIYMFHILSSVAMLIFFGNDVVMRILGLSCEMAYVL
jgi:hypothetical protein